MHPRATGGVLTEIVAAGGGRRATDGARRAGASASASRAARCSALRVSDEQLKALNKALGDGGWHELESEDGPVRLDLGQVVYVRAESDELRVGFSA